MSAESVVGYAAKAPGNRLEPFTHEAPATSGPCAPGPYSSAKATDTRAFTVI